MLIDKIRKSCSDIKVSDLNKDDGLTVLITKIKSLYAEGINTLAYLAYDQFENFKQPDEMSIVDYITYENMTKQLKAIYDSSENSVNNNDNFDVKCEPLYYANKLLDYSLQGPKDGY